MSERQAELERNIAALKGYIAAVEGNSVSKDSDWQATHLHAMRNRVQEWENELNVFEPFSVRPGAILVHQGDKRLWRVIPRQGTAWFDKWTILADPIPSPANPAAPWEDGQYRTLDDAWAALNSALAVDDGTHLRD